MNAPEAAQFSSWFEENGLPIDQDTLRKFNLYYDLIRSWSGRMNLVSKNDLPLLVPNHFLDSLGAVSLAPKHGQGLDIGSGAGFPGVPLALVCPRVGFTLLESTHKKVIFLETVKKSLELENITVLESRLEDLKGEGKYDFAMVRALPRREKFLPKVKKQVKSGGIIILFEKRGQYSQIEVA